ncbi:MAG: hypothetical protein V4850_02605 [Myxococcota bacterium]
MPRPPAPESLDPALVLLLLEDDNARRRLTSWLGTRQVDEMVALAGRGVPEEDEQRRVVVLHGIMGGQLVDRRGVHEDVIWFDLPHLLYADGIERLRLTEAGRDAARGSRLEATRPLRILYDLLAWHLAGVGGFRVHSLAYDWRKNIDLAAEKLHGDLEALAAGDDDARFTVVAHSLGGVVTMRYATRFPAAARRRLEQVVVMGSPLAGCFEPFQLWSGVHPTAARVDQVSGRGDLVRQVFATFPSMAELCPDPRRFDSEALLDARTWPDLPTLGPLFGHGRAWRDKAGVPDFLLDRLDVVLSAAHDTCVGLVRGPSVADPVTQRLGPGDGSVPVASAWCPGARGHYAVPTHHPLMPLDHGVRALVVALVASNGASGGETARVASLAELESAHPGPTADAAPPAPLQSFQARAGRGDACNGDGMWLLGCNVASPGDPTAGGRPLDRVAPRGSGPREPRPL